MNFWRTDIIDEGSTGWWSGFSVVVSNVATAVTAGLGAWFLSRRKVSADSSFIHEDKVNSRLLDTLMEERKSLLQERKEILAEKEAAVSTAQQLMTLRMEDAKLIVRMETENKNMAHRMQSCENAVHKAEVAQAEADERSRVLSEQLLFSHLRGRQMFKAISELDPIAASQIVKDQLDVTAIAAAETVQKAHEEQKHAADHLRTGHDDDTQSRSSH